MNILLTSDVRGWAIDNLSQEIMRHNQRFNFIHAYVHPRGVAGDARNIKRILKENRIDLWWCQYWNSGYQLMDLCHELKPIPKLLTHHNHYALKEKGWNEFNSVNEMTRWGCEVLFKQTKTANVFRIPHGIDLDKYSYIEDFQPDENTVGYVGRVISHKNLHKISEVCQRLGYKVLGTGYIDKPDYWEKVPKGDHLEFNGGFGRTEVPPENFKNELYRRMSVFVMYSTGEVESGTLPLLEAMARGVPVMATEQGMARDLIEDGKNGILFDDGNFEEKLKMLMENPELRQKIREEAWRTIRRYSVERMARDYALAYYRTMWGKAKVISVVIPTFKRSEQLLESMLAIEAQDYPAKEIIVCDDGSDDETPTVVAEAKKQLKTPILYVRTGDKDTYGLAKARNKGAIEALGDIVLFLDDRLKLEPDCLEQVAKCHQVRTFYHGKKINRDGNASGKKAFVENFSWVDRKSFFEAGMFCERMEWYGGLSEETRLRFKAQGFGFSYQEKAAVREMAKSGRMTKRRESWKAKNLIDKMYEQDRLR